MSRSDAAAERKTALDGPCGLCVLLPCIVFKYVYLKNRRNFCTPSAEPCCYCYSTYRNVTDLVSRPARVGQPRGPKLPLTSRAYWSVCTVESVKKRLQTS